LASRGRASRWLFAAEIFFVASVTAISCSFAAAAPDAARSAASETLARARLVDAAGASAALELESPPEIFPQLTVVRALPEPLLTAPAILVLPYTDALVHDWDIEDERELGLLTEDASGTWSWKPASVDASTNTIYAAVESGASWAAGPPWMMRAWQKRQLVGDDFRAGEHNVLVIHGWNSDPWDGCMLGLASALAIQYDNVAAAAYPTALDIADSAVWLRSEIEERWTNIPFDVVGFSEGGLVARAAIEPHEWNNNRPIAGDIRRLVTIAAPHTGVLASATFSVLNDEGARQMRADSDFLRELNTNPAHGGVSYEFIAGDIGGGNDSIVSTASALGAGAVTANRSRTLPLAHSPATGVPGLPCDALVYDTIASWR
jgi:hypothetical protein